MADHSSFIENAVVETRIMGFWRWLRDEFYYRLAMIVPVQIQYRTGWLIDARGYFDGRDTFEFPAIGRWHSWRSGKRLREVSRG